MQETHRTATQHKPSDRVGEDIPALISKKWLCCHFGLMSGGRPMYQTMYTKVLTQEVIEAAGMKVEDVRRRGMHVFNAIQSAAIRRVLFPVVFLFMALGAFGQTTRDTIFRVDTIYGIGMIRDTILCLKPYSGPSDYNYTLAPVVTASILDLYSVTRWIEITDSKFGQKTPVVQSVGYFKTTNCEPVKYDKIFYFKQTE